MSLLCRKYRKDNLQNVLQPLHAWDWIARPKLSQCFVSVDVLVLKVLKCSHTVIPFLAWISLCCNAYYDYKELMVKDLNRRRLKI